MDITIDVGEYRLNMRATGLIIHKNKLLVHKDIREEYCTLLGGRVTFGENSVDTIKREVEEELGKRAEVIGYIGTIENFFEANQRKYHEIILIHQVEFTNSEDKEIEYTLHNIEGKEYLQYEWIDLEKIQEYEIRPRCLKEILVQQKFPIHKINDELKNKKIKK